MTHSVEKKEYFNRLEEKRTQTLINKEAKEKSDYDRVLLKFNRNTIKDTIQREVTAILKAK